MNTTHKTILEVYQEVMKNAQYYREQEEQEKKDGNHGRAEKMGDIAHELYKVAAALELTEEINPL